MLVITKLQRHNFVILESGWTEETRRSQLHKWKVSEYVMFWIPSFFFSFVNIVFLMSFCTNVADADLKQWGISVATVFVEAFIVFPILRGIYLAALASGMRAMYPNLLANMRSLQSERSLQSMVEFEDGVENAAAWYRCYKLFLG